MKNINNFISEKLIIDKDIKMSSTGKDYWSCKDISKPEMLKYQDMKILMIYNRHMKMKNYLHI